MSLSSLLTIILGFMCLAVILNAYFKKDKAIIWSPLTFLTLTIIYYLVIPEFLNSREFESYDVTSIANTFHVGAIISYLSILAGYFLIKRKRKDNWQSWNTLFTEDNVCKIGVVLFIFAMACHIPFRGFHISFLNDGSELSEFDYSAPGLSYYFINMIAILCASCCMLLPKWKKHKLLLIGILWLTLVAFIVSGFRYRIVILVISMFTFYHLYADAPKKIKFLPIILIGYVCYVGFNIMDHARDYGNGIRLDKIANMDKNEVTAQAGETQRIYNYSILVMNTYDTTGKREYFAPLVNAICMPLPRAIFPWKPNADYLYSSANFVMRGGGAASVYVNFVEAFMAFGWIGIIINGLFIGWLARRFWNNYRNNRKSFGAIIALALFNGLTYVIISRGYLAQEFSCFLFYVCMPFWLSMVVKKIIKL